tara:strand:+ start:800 stop:1396 length:597 start_codon:yes stop_codon:yes gene_type:complete
MKINKKGLNIEVGRQLAPILQRRVSSSLLRAAREVERILIKQFESHPVTKEISGGSSSSNVSGTLGGYGNLFTYIGFDDSDDPIEIIRNILTNSIKVTMLPPKGKQMVQEAIISLPSKAEIEAATPLPWASGRSWAKGIEEGIANFGKYLNKQSRNVGRSGGGVQIKENISGRSFRSVSYLSEILDGLQSNIRQAIRR